MDLEIVAGSAKGVEALTLEVVTWVTASLEGPPHDELEPRGHAGLGFCGGNSKLLASFDFLL